MSDPTRPILRWHGGKWRLAPWVIQHLPPHKIYVEPFGGAASILLRKPRSTTEIYNDADADLVNLFKVIRERCAELSLALLLTPYARDEYSSLYEASSDPVERARRFVARSFMGMSSKGALAKSGFDTRVNRDAFVARLRSLTCVPDELASVAGRMTHVVIENCDALTLIERFDRPDALLYCDPPYVLPPGAGSHYRHKLDEDGHCRLLAVLRSTSAMVVLSGYPSQLYADQLAEWRSIETPSRTDGSHDRTEVLWLNRAACSALDQMNGSGNLFASLLEAGA